MDVRTGKVVNKFQFPAISESGMLSTDGDLLFNGRPDGHLVAYDSDTLKEAWSFSLGTPITAPPMTYSVGGKQYVAVVAGGAVGTRGGGLYQPTAIVAVFGF
jgi:alcohol dehydrogenase (cytochrome c)